MPDAAKRERGIIRSLKRRLAVHPRSKKLAVALARHRHALRTLIRPKAQRTSSKGIAFIRREEGCVLHPYNDSQGYATIGVGHLLHYSRVTAADSSRWAHFTQADADALLRNDLARFEAAVRSVFKGARLTSTPNRFDACVSLAFNIGTGGFLGSTVARQIRAGNDQAAADAFLNWSKPAVLRGRRERERTFFLS